MSIEILAPVGQPAHLDVAFEECVDSVYVGLKNHSARPDHFAFTLDEISEMRAKTQGSLRLYVAVNNSARPGEEEKLYEALEHLARINVDAVILSDWGLAHEASSRLVKLPIHMSTLAGIQNSAAIEMARAIGASRAVLNTNITRQDVRLLASRAHLPLEVIGAGGVCLFDNFRCRLTHTSGNRIYGTQCSKSITWLAENATYTGRAKLNNLISLREYESWGVSCIKIEGRTRSAEDIRALIRTLRDPSKNAIKTVDPYGPHRMTQTTRSLSTFKTEWEEVPLRFLRDLFRHGKVDADTTFWFMPFGNKLTACPITFQGWDGMVVNDLDGPPFEDVSCFDLPVQWQSPMYCTEEHLPQIVDRMRHFIELDSVQALRVHDVGLLSLARKTAQRRPKITWDRFGWPGRVSAPLPSLERFLLKTGVTCLEYGADQYIDENSPVLEMNRSLLVVPGFIQTLIPPSLRNLFSEASGIRCGAEMDFCRIYGPMILSEWTSNSARYLARLPYCQEVVLCVSGCAAVERFGRYIRELKN